MNADREYVTDVDVDVARKAIQTIGHVAWRLPTSASRVIEELLKLLELDIDYVSAETVIAMKGAIHLLQCIVLHLTSIKC